MVSNRRGAGKSQRVTPFLLMMNFNLGTRKLGSREICVFAQTEPSQWFVCTAMPWLWPPHRSKGEAHLYTGRVSDGRCCTPGSLHNFISVQALDCGLTSLKACCRLCAQRGFASWELIFINQGRRVVQTRMPVC